jgi:hypothetical protein
MKTFLTYENRIMVGVIFAEALFYAVFTFWPSNDYSETRFPAFENESLEIMLDQIEITRHSSSRPPPPKPIVPVVVPNDEIIEDELILVEMNIPDSPFAGLGDVGNLPDQEGDGIVGSPTRPPSVLKIVEPVFPKEAQVANVKATISVRFVVTKDGDVEEAFVDEIKRYDSKLKRFIIVDRVGYSLVEITLQAALQWKFRPARHEGKNVKAYARYEFSFGS